MQFVKLREQKYILRFNSTPNMRGCSRGEHVECLCAPTPPRTNWLIFILKVAFICEPRAVVLGCGLYFMVCGCKYAAWQDNLLRDQTGSGYCTFYLGKIKPDYAEWSFWLRRSWKLKLNCALKVSRLIDRTWKFAEIATGCDEGAPSPVFLVHLWPKKQQSWLFTITWRSHLYTETLSHSSAVRKNCNYGVKDVGKKSPGEPLTGDKTALKSCACLLS